MRLALLAVVLGLLLAPATTQAAPAAASTAPSTTGRLLVVLHAPVPTSPQAHAARAASRALAARTRARSTSIVIPQLRTVVLRARAGASLSALARRLRADPAVASVHREARFRPRFVPNDPAFTTEERNAVSGTSAEWWAVRLGLPAAWDITRGDGARVAVIDSGIDAGHPDVAGRIVASASFDDEGAGGPAMTDASGHGTHVASLACGAPGNGVGLAGAGGNCDLLIAKSDLSESSVARALIWAADNGAEAINMSFGTDGRVPADATLVQALRYAAGRGAVLVAAASDAADPAHPSVTEQGDPANVLQPTGTGADLTSNLGLSVTAATGADTRATFAGRGSQISLAAYGTYADFGEPGPPGILGAFPEAPTSLEQGAPGPPPVPPCRCRTTFGDDRRYAYLRGTSMAAPMVAGIAALMRHLNPALPPATVVRLLKQTARRPSAATGWQPELGWGIVDAAAALAAARATDATAPVSQLLRARASGRSILLRWRGRDPTVNRVAASGVDRYEIWRSAGGRPARRVAVTPRSSLRVRGMRGQRYAFFTVAIDHAGNREPPPARADTRVRIAR
jgi:serine protease